MKTTTALFVLVLLTGCSSPTDEVIAPDTAATGASMPDAEHKQMMPGRDRHMAAESVTAVTAVGIVAAIDVAAGKITITHEPIEALQWPAMTMGFKASPEQIALVHVGMRVQFEFVPEGMNGSIQTIQPR